MTSFCSSLQHTQADSDISLDGLAQVRAVTLFTDDKKSLGFNIEKGELVRGAPSVLISSISAGGPADIANSLQVGDQILSVDGQKILGYAYDKVSKEKACRWCSCSDIIFFYLWSMKRVLYQGCSHHILSCRVSIRQAHSRARSRAHSACLRLARLTAIFFTCPLHVVSPWPEIDHCVRSLSIYLDSAFKNKKFGRNSEKKS